MENRDWYSNFKRCRVCGTLNIYIDWHTFQYVCAICGFREGIGTTSGIYLETAWLEYKW